MGEAAKTLHGSAHRGPAAGQCLYRLHRNSGATVVVGLGSGRFSRQRSDARASGCERDPSPQRGHARFQKEEKDDSRPQPEARTRSSKSLGDFFCHITTLLLGLSIRKPTELKPKSPVLLPGDVIRGTKPLKFGTNSSPGRQRRSQRCFAGDLILSANQTSELSKSQECFQRAGVEALAG